LLKIHFYSVHWIPPEFFEIPSLCKSSGTADIWSFGTTLWEIFSLGEAPGGNTPIPIAEYKSVRERECLVVLTHWA